MGQELHLKLVVTVFLKIMIKLTQNAFAHGLMLIEILLVILLVQYGHSISHFQHILTLIQMAIKSAYPCGWESFMAARRPIGSREDSLWEPPYPCCTPTGHLGVIYYSQPAGTHKRPKRRGGSSYFLIGKLPETVFLDKSL
jgi:hypothetical protein